MHKILLDNDITVIELKQVNNKLIVDTENYSKISNKSVREILLNLEYYAINKYKIHTIGMQASKPIKYRFNLYLELMDKFMEEAKELINVTAGGYYFNGNKISIIDIPGIAIELIGRNNNKSEKKYE